MTFVFVRLFWGAQSDVLMTLLIIPLLVLFVILECFDYTVVLGGQSGFRWVKADGAIPHGFIILLHEGIVQSACTLVYSFGSPAKDNQEGGSPRRWQVAA